jgi:deoxyribodipyrimidine photo-lyase
MKKHLVWLRADLRSIDNTALTAACADPEADIAAVYFITPKQWQQHHVAGCRVDFELRTLQHLSKQLAALNIPLLIVETANFYSQAQALLDLCQQHLFSAVYFNKQYEINELARDESVQQLLAQHHINTFDFDDQCLVAPYKVLTGEGRFYSVFTPFKKTWLQCIYQQGVNIQSAPDKRPSLWLTPSYVPKRVTGFESHITEEIAHSLWPAGEEAALDKLARFCDDHIRNYKDKRDFPNLDDSTSRLSPYLAIGAISPRQCYQAAINEQQAYGPSAGIDQWISELGWREFYKHIMVGFPRVCKHQPFRTDTKDLVWKHDEAAFQRWCAGKTGFPLVDAAMRQLNTIGWMHNRLRMVVSMFLTKDLFIDWRWGEQYFMEKLLDGDLAANNGGWQWSASTGNDSAPYFRIFNPLLQSQKFDPNGDFIRRYVPELAHLDNKTIHQPHDKQQLLWLDYPLPMIDHKAACAFTISQFQQLKELPIGRADND